LAAAAAPPGFQPPAGPAINDQNASKALTRYRRRAWYWMLGAILALVVFLVVVGKQSDRSK
jgi:hypothetical protein